MSNSITPKVKENGSQAVYDSFSFPKWGFFILFAVLLIVGASLLFGRQDSTITISEDGTAFAGGELFEPSDIETTIKENVFCVLRVCPDVEMIEECRVVGYEPIYERLSQEEYCKTNECSEEDNLIAGDAERIVKIGETPIEKCKQTEIKVGTETINFAENNVGCHACGNDIICWDKNDGLTENRAEWARCKCLSGESCAIYKADGLIKLYERSDMGVILNGK